MRKIRKKKKGHAARLKRIKKCIKLKCRMIRRKKKGRNDATEGRGISTIGEENVKKCRRRRRRSFRQLIKIEKRQTLLGRFANR